MVRSSHRNVLSALRVSFYERLVKVPTFAWIVLLASTSLLLAEPHASTAARAYSKAWFERQAARTASLVDSWRCTEQRLVLIVRLGNGAASLVRTMRVRALIVFLGSTFTELVKAATCVLLVAVVDGRQRLVLRTSRLVLRAVGGGTGQDLVIRLPVVYHVALVGGHLLLGHRTGAYVSHV